MHAMRNPHDWRDTSIPMAALFVIGLFFAIVANIVAAAWIAGL